MTACIWATCLIRPERQGNSSIGIDRKCLPTRPDSQISPCALDPGVGRSRATSFPCQASSVSGLTTATTSAKVFFPNRVPSSATVGRSPSVSRTRPVIYFRNMRFSATRYSLRNNRSWSTGPVIEARYVFHSIALPPGHDDVPVGMEYQGSGWGEASGRGVLRC